MIRYNKSVIDWFLEQQLLSSDPVNNCILSLPRTRYLYLRWSFFLMKHSWTNSLNLSLSLEWGIVV